MPGGLAPELLLEWLVTAIETHASTEDLTQVASDQWHEASRPFSPVDEADPVAHLAFTVLGDDWDPIGSQVEDELNMDRIAISVLFTYHLRPDRQNADYRLAFRAARAVAKVVGSTTWWGHGAVTVETVRKASVGVIPEQPYALVESRFIVTFNPGD